MSRKQKASPPARTDNRDAPGGCGVAERRAVVLDRLVLTWCGRCGAAHHLDAPCFRSKHFCTKPSLGWCTFCTPPPNRHPSGEASEQENRSLSARSVRRIPTLDAGAAGLTEGRAR